MCFAPQRRALFRHLDCQKWSGPDLVCFVHFDFDMCFAPQRRALFRHLNLQKWSEPLVFWTFWLRNVLRATTACTFLTSQLQKVVRPWCVLCILSWKCAPRHNGVQFFISHLASWLRTRRFSEPTFRPSRASNHWKKHSVSRLSYLFAHLHLLSSDSFSATLLSSNLPLLSASSLLCFSSVHIVGSLTSKLPSNMRTNGLVLSFQQRFQPWIYFTAHHVLHLQSISFDLTSLIDLCTFFASSLCQGTVKKLHRAISNTWRPKVWRRWSVSQ